jgi:hypothetical protein
MVGIEILTLQGVLSLNPAVCFYQKKFDFATLFFLDFPYEA